MNKENEIIELESKIDFTLLDSRATENDYCLQTFLLFCLC